MIFLKAVSVGMDKILNIFSSIYMCSSFQKSTFESLRDTKQILRFVSEFSFVFRASE